MRPKALPFLLAALWIAASLVTSGQTAGSEADARPPVTKADLHIVARARKILDSSSKWNRADTRQCPPQAKTFSLYCALEKATDEVTGNFEHRGAAMQEARFVIEDISPKGRNYDHRLMGYNNDPSTTFADIQNVFRRLEARIAKQLKEQPSAQATAAIPRASADLEILKRARALLSSEDKWNRADTQDCPKDAATVSLFCAFYRAAIEATGSFNNKAAAIQEARSVISESAPNRAKYQSRLTDFNNDASVTFSDIQNLFVRVEERLAKRLSQGASK